MLTQAEKKELVAAIEAGREIPAHWRARLFPEAAATVEIGKEYKLVYAGKAKREEILADTPAAPWQLVRRFCSERPFDDGWQNLLVFGDNLLALRGLLEDQQGPDRFRTRGRIKLVYIDPPFATRQDFMKDKEKAYCDKVLGAQFIEFLRRRLVLLREVMADDASIYVHLDTKKGHYIKAVLDEVFGEENFRNEIIWRRSTSHSDAERFGQVHDTIFFYSRSDHYIWNTQYRGYSQEYIERYFRFREPDGRRYWKEDATAAGSGPPRRFGDRTISPPAGRHWRWVQSTIDKYWAEGRFVLTRSGKPEFKRYLDNQEGEPVASVWDDIKRINMMADERLEYPTQKPETVLERILRASSNPGDIVLDCFAGSGTTAAVAEKLGRRWIAMDCGKLAIYTVQKRMFSLTTTIGAAKKDERTEPERVEDWAAHLKNAPGVLLITEKARKGECEVTLDLLHDLAALALRHGFLKKSAAFSLACPEDKLRVPPDTFEDIGDAEPPGQKRVKIGGVDFRISIVAPREKPEKEQPLPAREFALYSAGVYDHEAIRSMPWTEYRDFVSQPVVRVKAHRGRKGDGLFRHYLLDIIEFRSRTLATDPEDFPNFATFSMAMVDTDYDGKVFTLDKVFWGEDLLAEAGGLDAAKKLTLAIPEEDFRGARMMIVLCDRYGNEKVLTLAKDDFDRGHRLAQSREGRQV